MTKNLSGHSTKKSMIPLILPSDKVVVTKKGKIRLNDIVVFKENGRLIAHRVVFINPKEKTLITKGDNNTKVDKKISEKDILGKVEKIKRAGNTLHIKHQYLSQSSSYLKEIKNIEKNLQAKDVEHIFLKGLPLYLNLFKKPPRRLYLDTDLLIHKKSLDAVEKILIDEGFERAKNRLYGKEVKNPTQINYYKEGESYPVIVDLHLEPAVGFTKDRQLNKLGPSGNKLSRYLFLRRNIVEIEEEKFPMLEINALLIYLLLHFYHHNFNGPHRINLISKIIKNYEISWEKVMEDTKHLGITSYIYPSLLVVNRLYKDVVPKKVLKKIKPSWFKKYSAKLLSILINPLNEPLGEKERLKRFLFLCLYSEKNLYKRVKILLSKKVLKKAYLSINSLFSRRLVKSS